MMGWLKTTKEKGSDIISLIGQRTYRQYVFFAAATFMHDVAV